MWNGDVRGYEDAEVVEQGEAETPLPNRARRSVPSRPVQRRRLQLAANRIDVGAVLDEKAGTGVKRRGGETRYVCGCLGYALCPEAQGAVLCVRGCVCVCVVRGSLETHSTNCSLLLMAAQCMQEMPSPSTALTSKPGG